jgi:membrane associated rhomboid family serine protease
LKRFFAATALESVAVSLHFGSMEPTQPEPPPREPIFQAPWPAVALVGFILACFAAELWLGPDRTVTAWGFSPAALDRGSWVTLVTAIFVHGGWLHVCLNSAFILAFGTPVARRMGIGPVGALAYFTYFLVCGILGNLAFWALHPHEAEPLVGASGAGSALMAAASRLLTRGPRLAPLASQPVVTMAAAFLVANLIIAVVGWAPGAGDAKIAWEVHLGGYAAGLLLFEPVLGLLGRR